MNSELGLKLSVAVTLDSLTQLSHIHCQLWGDNDKHYIMLMSYTRLCNTLSSGQINTHLLYISFTASCLHSLYYFTVRGGRIHWSSWKAPDRLVPFKAKPEPWDSYRNYIKLAKSLCVSVSIQEKRKEGKLLCTSRINNWNDLQCIDTLHKWQWSYSCCFDTLCLKNMQAQRNTVTKTAGQVKKCTE